MTLAFSNRFVDVRPGGCVRLCFCSRAAPAWRNRLQLGRFWPAAGAPRLSVSPRPLCAQRPSTTRPASVAPPQSSLAATQTRSNTNTTNRGWFVKTSTAQLCGDVFRSPFTFKNIILSLLSMSNLSTVYLMKPGLLKYDDNMSCAWSVSLTCICL